MRPIDADALKKRLLDKDAVVMTLLGIFDIIDAGPTIDVADVTGEKKLEMDKSL